MWLRAIAGAVLLIAGAVFFVQGIGTLHGSVMTGHPFYAVLGAVLAVAGAALIVWAARSRGGPGRRHD